MDERVNNAIIFFLKDQGYEDSARKLLEESQLLKETVAASSTSASTEHPPSKRLRLEDELAKKKAFKASLNNNANGENEIDLLDAYSESYRRLQEWLLLTLDQFREELWPVSWVVYVHLYLKLVEEDRTTLAVSFREEHKSYHMYAHDEEIRALSLVNTSKHMKDSDYVKRVKKNRFEIYLCNYSVEILVSFLLKNEMLFILSIVNDHIHIINRPNKARVPPPSVSALVRTSNLDTSSNIVTGISSEDTARLNSSRVQWGVPLELQSLYDQTNISGKLDQLAAELNLDMDEVSGRKKVDSGIAKRGPSAAAEKSNPKHCPPYEPKRYFAELVKHIVDPQRIPLKDIGKLIIEQSKNNPNPSADKLPKPGAEADKEKSASPRMNDKEAKEAQTKEKETQQRQQEQNKSIYIERKKSYGLGEWPSIALSTFFNCHDELVCVDYDRSGTVTAAGFDNSRIRLWQQNVESSMNSDSNGEGLPHVENLIGHSGPVYSVNFSREGRSLLSSSADGYIRLWMYLPSEQDDSEIGIVNGRYVKPTGSLGGINEKLWHNVFAFRPQRFSTPCPVWDVQFSPVGHYFASGSHDNSCRLWDVEHDQHLRSFNKHLSDVDCVQWHPNCHYLATGSSDKTVRLWDIRDASSQSCRLFCGHIDSINALTIDPSGRYLISGGQDKLIYVWDIAAGKRINSLQGHTGPIWTLDVSPDGRYLSSGSADGTIRVWNTSQIWGKHTSSASKSKDEKSQVKFDRDGVQPENEAFIRASDQSVTRSDPVKESTRSNMYNIVRTFRTKYTPVNMVRFHNERLILAAGSFALPLMT